MAADANAAALPETQAARASRGGPRGNTASPAKVWGCPEGPAGPRLPLPNRKPLSRHARTYPPQIAPP